MIKQAEITVYLFIIAKRKYKSTYQHLIRGVGRKLDSHHEKFHSSGNQTNTFHEGRETESVTDQRHIKTFKMLLYYFRKSET